MCVGAGPQFVDLSGFDVNMEILEMWKDSEFFNHSTLYVQ